MHLNEYKTLITQQDKRSKYANKRVQFDGIWFDSKMEAAYYAGLRHLEQSGEVRDIEVHPKFMLDVNGMHICSYEADFRFLDDDQKRVVDVKGVETREFKIKRRLMKAIHGIEVEVI